MATSQDNWHVGDIVTLTRETRLLKKTLARSYSLLCESHYLCIRQANPATAQRGILVKVLGRRRPQHVITVSGQPFCKDDLDEAFTGDHYYSYPFPQSRDVQEVLDILTDNRTLLDQLDAADMHVNPRAHFWVSETARHMLVQCRPQYYDPATRTLAEPHDDTAPYRIAIVHFYKGQLFW